MEKLEKALNDKNFMDLELREKKEYILECIKNGLITDLYNSGIVLYKEYNINQLMIMLDKTNKVNFNNEYFHVLNKQMIRIMSSMQSQHIKMINTSRYMRFGEDIHKSFTAPILRMGTAPILNYNIDGVLTSIERSASTSPLDTATSLIDFFDKRFLINQDINRLVKRI